MYTQLSVSWSPGVLSVRLLYHKADHTACHTSRRYSSKQGNTNVSQITIFISVKKPQFMLFITSLYKVQVHQHHIVQASFYDHHSPSYSRVRALSSNPLRRLRLAMLRTKSVIPTLARVILHTAHTALDTLGLVSDLLANLGLDSLGVLGGGTHTLEAGALALAAAGLHAVQLVARLALDRPAVLGLVVDGLACGSGKGVESPRARGGFDVRVETLPGRGVDGVGVVRVLLGSGAGGEGLCAELGHGFVAYLLT